MSLVVKDFDCPKCGITERIVDFGVSSIICCGVTAQSLISAPKVIRADSFNPHFDLTQGVYFKSQEHKKAWLASKEKEQVEGGVSPRTSGGGRILCSETQAKKLIGKRAGKVKNSEIPGLRKNRRTSISFSAPSK